MVTATLLHEVRHLAYAPARRVASWMPALPFLPAVRAVPTARPQRVAHRSGRAAFVYYAHAGHLVVVRSGGHGFGIPPGTFIAARLMRPVTSGDSALIVLHTVAPVAGTGGVLGAGAQLLARAQQVAGNRLLLTVRQIVTPHGRTMPVIAVVFSRDYRLGLSGFVESKAPARAWRALGRSLIASADQALSLVGGGGATPAAALGRAGSAVLREPISWRRQQPVLYVPPQKVEVQLERPL